MKMADKFVDRSTWFDVDAGWEGEVSESTGKRLIARGAAEPLESVKIAPRPIKTRMKGTKTA